MTVVGHARSQGTAFQPKAPDKGHGRHVGLVAIDNHHLQNVVLHIADDAAVHHLGFRREVFGNHLTINTINHLDFLSLIGDEEVLREKVRAVKKVGRIGFLVLDI